MTTKLYRKLYGYKALSNFGKYKYEIDGILDKIPSVRYPDGNILI